VVTESSQTQKSVRALLDSSWTIKTAKTALEIAQSAQMPAHAQSASILSNSSQKKLKSSHKASKDFY
jgi:hypothetical protein